MSAAGERPGAERGAHRRVKCPRCGHPTTFGGNPWRPFCSERCKLIDLGEWVEGRYAIPSEDTPGSEDEDA